MTPICAFVRRGAALAMFVLGLVFAAPAQAEGGPGDRSVGPEAAALAAIVAEKSPLLSGAARKAISADFHGAPISSKFKTHKVTAQGVTCRQNLDAPLNPRCTITYSKKKKVDFTGEKAADLFNAMGKVEIFAQSGMGETWRSLDSLVCLVDDRRAQTQSSSGDKVEGFSCTFHVTY